MGGIIRAHPKDWNKIKGELIKVEKQIFGELAFTEEQFDTFQNPEAFNLLVYYDNKIIGYLMSQRLSDSGEHNRMINKDKIFYLESVGLLSEYTGKGIGKELMQAYLNHGIKLKCKSYLLDTKEESMIGLAERVGFKKVSYNKKHFKDGNKWIGAWIMAKEVKK